MLSYSQGGQMTTPALLVKVSTVDNKAYVLLGKHEIPIVLPEGYTLNILRTEDETLEAWCSYPFEALVMTAKVSI